MQPASLMQIIGFKWGCFKLKVASGGWRGVSVIILFDDGGEGTG